MNKNLKIMVLVGAAGIGVYLIWKGGYLAQWLPSVFGPAAATPPVTGATPAAPVSSPAAPVSTAGATPAALDVTGLTVVPDINNSLMGTVKINGVPTVLAIIQSDGRIFDNTGTEVSAKLTAAGVDLSLLRNAFASAPHSLAGLSGFGWTA